jgi:hypothetical protein
MPYAFFKFAHVGSMFLATALAIGPSILLYLVTRNGGTDTIRRTFAHTTAVFRAGGAFYGLGLLFGFITAANGSIGFSAPWLVAAYVLILVLIGFNFGFERWTHRVTGAVAEEGGGELAAVLRSRRPLVALTGMITTTLLLVFVMVVKPTF